jgi:Na+/melibiose symporter-like transporter
MNDPSLYNESSPQWENKIFCTIFKNDKFLFMIGAHCCSTIQFSMNEKNSVLVMTKFTSTKPPKLDLHWWSR